MFASGHDEEIYRPLGEALEVSWRIREHRGSGDLVVTVSTSGVVRAAVDDAGARLETLSGAHLRVGHATWVDAAGVHSSVPVEWSDGRLRYAVAAALVARSRFPAVLDPLVYPEAPVTGDTFDPSQGTSAAVATDGTSHLVVWQGWGTYGNLLTNVIAADGTVANPRGIDTQVDDVGSPLVAFDGAHYLAVWSGSASTVKALRLTPAGNPVDAAPVTIASNRAGSVAIAGHGSNLLVVWTASDGIYSARIGPGLVLLQQPRRLIAANEPSSVTAAWGGGQFLVAWDDVATGHTEARFVRVDASGALLDASARKLASGGNPLRPAVASSGSQFAVSWLGLNAELRFTRIAPSGAILDPGGIEVEPRYPKSHRILFDGANYLFLYDDFSHQVYAVRFDPAGARLDAQRVPLGSGNHPGGSFLNGSLLLTYEATEYFGGISARIFDPQLVQQGTDRLVAGVLAQQTSPKLACNRSLCLAGFQRGAARLGLDGTSLDPAGLPLSPDMVASDGADFLAAWMDASTHLRVAQVRADGQIVPPGGYVLATNAYPRALAGASGHYLLAWAPWSGSGRSKMARLDPLGRLLDVPPVDLPFFPTAAIATGSQYFVLGAGLARRYGSDLAPLSSAPIQLPAMQSYVVPGLAFDGSHYLIGTGGQLVRVGLDGQIADVRNSTSVHLAFDGTDTWTFASSGPGLDARRMNQAGAWRDPVAMPVTSLENGGVAVASAGAGRLLLAYAQRVPPGTQRLRVRAISAEPGPAGTWCTSGADCLSGRCVDLVCCDSDCGGGDPGDCQACSVEAGAAQDGACGPVTLGRVCRPTAGPCDVAEVCEGSPQCPADALLAAGTVCRKGWTCTSDSTCDGTTAACPALAPSPDGTPCPASSECVLRSECYFGTCQAFEMQPDWWTSCLSGVCDRNAGLMVEAAPDGTECGYGDCLGKGTCVAGSCQAPAIPCDTDGCSSLRCDDAGPCVRVNEPDGTVCDDGNPCTLDDHCERGACQGALKSCGAPGYCDDGVACNPLTGSCEAFQYYASPRRACDDGDPCTYDTYCERGDCLGRRIECTAGACHTNARCDSATGQCVEDPVPDGTPCDDRNVCTVADHCVAGRCSSTPARCQGVDACHLDGTCDPATGACTSPRAPDGTACGGSPCVVGSTCLSGGCGQATSCLPSGPCRIAAACERSDGLCHEQPAPDGSPCDDGDPCTVDDSCTAGACAGAPYRCVPADGCHLAGACDPATGVCSSPLAPDLTPCDDGDGCTGNGTCKAGLCQPGAALVCPADPARCIVGICQPGGACASVAAPDGAPCEDSNPCTVGDFCSSGLCIAGAPKVCPGRPESCHVGVCDPSSGCTIKEASSGAPCQPESEDACALKYGCKSGVCVATARRPCDAVPCRKLVPCDAVTGQCDDSQFLPDGTSCEDGDLCTAKETCQSGTCLFQEKVVCPPPVEGFGPGTCEPMTGQCSYPRLPGLDAGSLPDASDQAVFDASVSDASVPDASSPDGSPGSPPVSHGCGCDSGSAPASWGLLLVCAALLPSWTRRRRRTATSTPSTSWGRRTRPCCGATR